MELYNLEKYGDILQMMAIALYHLEMNVVDKMLFYVFEVNWFFRMVEAQNTPQAFNMNPITLQHPGTR